MSLKLYIKSMGERIHGPKFVLSQWGAYILGAQHTCVPSFMPNQGGCVLQSIWPNSDMSGVMAVFDFLLVGL